MLDFCAWYGLYGADNMNMEEAIKEMIIESMEMNGEYTTDNLYIQQVCSE